MKGFRTALACLFLCGAVHAQVKPTPRAILDTYCVTCHNQRLKTAGLMLDSVDVTRIGGDPALWEKVLHKVRTAAMPPPGTRVPDASTYRQLSSYLETELDRAAAARPNAGRPVAIHRLNRAEYTNAIRDLLALDIDGRAMLPPDDTGYGFDNIGDVLSISPSLLERYLLAAQKISRRAVGATAMAPYVETFRVSPTLRQDDRAGSDAPFGTRGGLVVRRYFPMDGEYVMRIRLQRTYLEVVRGMNEAHSIDVRLDKDRVALLSVGGRLAGAANVSRDAREEYIHTADKDLDVRFAAKAGSHVVAVTFVNDRVITDGILEPQISPSSIIYAKKDFDAAIDHVDIEGPYNVLGAGDTPSRRRIFLCAPGGGVGQEACARRIISALARRAYRRPITQNDLQTLLAFYLEGARAGGFEAGIESALARILTDPEFLVRIEREMIPGLISTPASAEIKPGIISSRPYRVEDLALASRLSFFLWSSIPDDELLTEAERGRLHEPAVLARQVRRMLEDPRSDALITNFAAQWLYLRNVPLVAPDPDAFREFDDNLRQAMLQETTLFVGSILREDRSVLDFLRADYTFLNDRLARHYGIPGIYGTHFRRVTLGDSRRAGLLGQASILTVTSQPTRTSPVKRGKWLLENLLGAPPPPPPPNVPALQESDEGGKPASVRERLERHRRNPTCASCHASMDPLGFALENFDGIGRWRTKDGPTDIDPSGALPDGTTLSGSDALRGMLLARGEDFVTAFTEKLLTYALGRGLEYYDQPAVRAIVRKAKAQEFRWSAIVRGIVESTPFQMRGGDKVQ